MASLINVFPSVQQQLIPPKNYAKYELLLFFQTSFMLSCELKVGECLKEGRKNGSIILKHFVCEILMGNIIWMFYWWLNFFCQKSGVDGNLSGLCSIQLFEIDPKTGFFVSTFLKKLKNQAKESRFWKLLWDENKYLCYVCRIYWQNLLGFAL